MKAKIIFFSFIFLAFPFSSMGKIFTLKEGKINLDVPETWQEAEHLFGLELMILGPSKLNRRPVLSLDSTAFEWSFDSKKLKANEEQYKVGREAWLKNKNGKSFEFYPYEYKKISSYLERHSLGYTYEFADEVFEEKSYFLKCRNKLFHLKTLTLKKEETAQKLVLEKMINSFDCKA